MRGIKLIVAVAVTMLAASATASAACDLTISNGPQSGITEGPTGTFTSTANSAVLDVGTLTDRLSVGNANVNVGTVPCLQSGNITISNAVTWSTASSLTMFGTGDVAVNAGITATNGSAALNVQTSQGVSQTASASISVGGPTTVNLGFGSAALSLANNDFGQSISVPSAPDGIAIKDVNALQIAGANTNNGSLSITTGGALTQSAAVIVDDNTTIDTGTADVTLPHTGNEFGGSFGPIGSVTITAANDVVLNGTGDVHVNDVSATGNLDLTAGADIVGLGIQIVDGTTTLAAPASIALAGSFDNDFGGAVSATTVGPLTLRDEDNLILGTISSNGGDLFNDGTLTQTGAISDTSLFEAQANSITLTNAANDFSHAGFESDGGALVVRDTNDVVLHAVDATGAATVTAGLDIFLDPGLAAFTSSALTLVSDAGSPVGPGGISIPASRTLTSTAAPIRLYTNRRSENSIAAGATLNGANFTPGPEFVDSATEVWNTAFPAGTATNPFTIFYKQAAPPPPPVDPTPNTTLTKTPKKKVKTKKKKVKVAFEFTSDVTGATFECTLDGKSAPCASPFSKKVKKGKHEFAVVASAAGKTDPSPATYAFKVKRKRR